jgi:hypothetical protein
MIKPSRCPRKNDQHRTHACAHCAAASRPHTGRERNTRRPLPPLCQGHRLPTLWMPPLSVASRPQQGHMRTSSPNWIRARMAVGAVYNCVMRCFSTIDQYLQARAHKGACSFPSRNEGTHPQGVHAARTIGARTRGMHSIIVGLLAPPPQERSAVVHERCCSARRYCIYTQCCPPPPSLHGSAYYYTPGLRTCLRPGTWGCSRT